MQARAPKPPEARRTPPANFPWKALTIIAVGAGLLIGGLAGILAAQAPASPQHPQVSITAILQAAEAGELTQVTLNGLGSPSTYSLGTATLGTSSSTGSLAAEYGNDPQPGDKVNFYIPAELQPLLSQALLEANTPLWVGPGRTSDGQAPQQQREAGTGIREDKESPALEQSGEAGQVPEETSVAPEPLSKPTWFILLMMGLLVSGILLVARGSVLVITDRTQRTRGVKLHNSAIPETRFGDVAGADEAVEQMRELLDCLNAPEKYQEIGAKLPTGVLLVGPPGTGKTLLARALAGEAGVDFYSATGSQFVEMYVGVGAKRIRDLYSKARKSGKAIVFIDEVDAIARKRSEGVQANSNTETENTLIALLTELDGFSQNSSIVTIAATNRPDILDPALVRPGRLDRRIEVPLPDRRGRQHILETHSQEIALDRCADIERIARRTPGFSGAQLANVINEAALEAVRSGKSSVDNACLDAAIAHVAMGRARSSALVTEHDRQVTAWHEAGHAASALLLADADAPVAVSIVPRGPAGGVTWMSGSDEQFLTRSKAHARLVVALSGRAGEQLLLNGEYTQGAAGDLENATEIAVLMATRYGMTPLGLAARSQHLGGSGTTDVTEVVEDLLAQAHQEATKLLASRKDLVEAIATELLDKEDLDSEDLTRIANYVGVTPAGTPTPVPRVHTPTLRGVTEPPEPGRGLTSGTNSPGRRPKPAATSNARRRTPVLSQARGLTRAIATAIKLRKTTRGAEQAS